MHLTRATRIAAKCTGLCCTCASRSRRCSRMACIKPAYTSTLSCVRSKKDAHILNRCTLHRHRSFSTCWRTGSVGVGLGRVAGCRHGHEEGEHAAAAVRVLAEVVEVDADRRRQHRRALVDAQRPHHILPAALVRNQTSHSGRSDGVFAPVLNIPGPQTADCL